MALGITSNPLFVVVHETTGSNLGSVNIDSPSEGIGTVPIDVGNISIETGITNNQDQSFQALYDNPAKQQEGLVFVETLAPSVKLSIMEEIIFNNDNIKGLGDLSKGGWSWADSPIFLGFFPNWENLHGSNIKPLPTDISEKIISTDKPKPFDISDSLAWLFGKDDSNVSISDQAIKDTENESNSNKKVSVMVAGLVGALLLFG